ncbi:MAG: hypothetical protein V4735_02745 [Pseudomonadota bacterium]
MRKVDYDAKDTASTESHLSVDEEMKDVIDHPGSHRDHAFTEGFAASSGIHQELAEESGQLDYPEMLAELIPDPEPFSLEEENAVLVDG